MKWEKESKSITGKNNMTTGIWRRKSSVIHKGIWRRKSSELKKISNHVLNLKENSLVLNWIKRSDKQPRFELNKEKWQNIFWLVWREKLPYSSAKITKFYWTSQKTDGLGGILKVILTTSIEDKYPLQFVGMRKKAQIRLGTHKIKQFGYVMNTKNIAKKGTVKN